MSSKSLRKLFISFLIINFILIAYGRFRHQRTALTVTFLDVGQGDAAVIESAGGRVILIDTGGISAGGANDQGRSTVEPFLRRHGVNHIDAILLTHPHADHIGGADTLVNDIHTDLVMDNGEPTEPPLEVQLLADAARQKTAYHKAARGQQIDMGDGAKMEILAPDAAETAQDNPNNCSIVVRLTYGSTVFLLMGDAEEPEESDLLAERNNLKCDVLKVGHHGSDTSSTAAFLAAAHPHEAVVSVGAHNRYGHPSQQVLARLAAVGAHLDRTDLKGAVTCTSDGNAVRVETMR